ncbi:MAG: murein biosynthesis integral membrane protein MurJ, partial [Pseudomonadota bacterium]
MRPIRLLSGFFTVGLWTLLSRVMGFVRDLLIAAFLGSGPVADAFFAAFSLPNLFRRFFAEGAFNMAFVPLFAKKLEAEEDAKQFAEDAFSGLGLLLILLTLIGLVFMPALVSATAWGFRGDERFDLAVTYGRIAFPYVLLISLAALLSGVLNATGRFAAAAAAPVLLNLVFITVMAVTWVFGGIAALDFGLPMSWALPIAGVAQFGLVWFAAKRAGYALFPKVPKLTPELKRLMIIAVPAILANGVGQINLLVGRQVASRVEGAFSWLFYADRLYQLPSAGGTALAAAPRQLQ